MNWLPIIYGISAFLFVLVAHVFIWRIFKPKNQITLLFIIFLAIPFVVVMSGLFFIPFKLLLLSALMYFALSCAYIQTYPVFQAVTPSLQIVYFIKKSMPKGLTSHEISDKFSEGSLFRDRVDDLITEKFVYKKSESLYLTKKGAVIAGIFFIYRCLYGLKTGEG